MDEALLHGSLDAFEYNCLSGWVVYLDRPLGPLELEVIAEDRVLTTGMANLYRSDLVGDVSHTGANAFRIPLLAEHASLLDKIQIRVKGTDWCIPSNDLDEAKTHTPKSAPVGRRQLIMHFGVPKTGSTSIQHFLYFNRIALMQKSVCFYTNPGEGNLFFSSFNDDSFDRFAADDMRLSLSEARDLRLAPGLPRRAINQFQKARLRDLVATTQYHKFIISGEVAGLISPSAHMDVAAFTKSLGLDIKIVVYFREPGALLGASQQESIKNSIELPMPEYITTGSMQKNIEVWEAQYGPENISYRSFDRQFLTDGDVVADFAQAAQLDELKGLPPYRDMNLGISELGMQLAREMIRRSPPSTLGEGFAEGEVNPRVFLFPRTFLEQIPGEKYVPSSTEITAVRKQARPLTDMLIDRNSDFRSWTELSALEKSSSPLVYSLSDVSGIVENLMVRMRSLEEQRAKLLYQILEPKGGVDVQHLAAQVTDVSFLIQVTCQRINQARWPEVHALAWRIGHLDPGNAFAVLALRQASLELGAPKTAAEINPEVTLPSLNALLSTAKTKPDHIHCAIDLATEKVLHGWIYDEVSLSDRFEIFVYVDGKISGYARAAMFREDLQQANYADGHVAFEVKGFHAPNQDLDVVAYHTHTGYFLMSDV